MFKAYQFLILFLCFLGVSGCGSENKDSTESGNPPASTENNNTPTNNDNNTPIDQGDNTPTAEPTYSEMTFEQKRTFMQQVVMPEMKALFTEFDAEEFGRMNCMTCHGRTANSVNWKMPNGIEPLNPADIASDTSEMAVFMKEKVSPKMAELLGKEPWSPTNTSGFGCFNCHGQR